MDKNKDIWAAALRLLEMRPHSKKELKEKLLSKFSTEEGLVLQVIEEMERVHLLSDRRFTEAFIAYLTQKNIGRLRIMFETRKKGLPNDLVEQALLDQQWSENEAAQRAVEEKMRVLEGVDERRAKQKIANFLRNRGFTERVIFKRLN